RSGWGRWSRRTSARSASTSTISCGSRSRRCSTRRRERAPGGASCRRARRPRHDAVRASWYLVEVRVPADTAAFLTELPGFLATRDAANHPTAVEAVVLHLDPEAGVGEIAADARFARNTAANLRDNGRFALVISRVWEDHRSVQIKGRCLEVKEP